MDQIYQALQQPDVGDDQMSREFRHVKELVTNVNAVFGKVTERLLGFDVADFKDNYNNALRLSPQWREYFDVSITVLRRYPWYLMLISWNDQQRFRSILAQSCDSASTLSAFLLRECFIATHWRRC